MTDHEKVLEIIKLKDQAPLSFDARKTALLVVDAQRYFARAEYPFGKTFERLVPGSTAGYFERVETTVLPNIQRLQQAFRARRLPVIFCGAGSYMPDGSDLPLWLREFNGLSQMLLGQASIPPVNDPSWQFDETVAPLAGDMVLNKTSSGPLNSTKLDQALHNMGIDALVVCGLTTAVCVAQTARETADRGFRVVIAEDACTEMSEELHRAALETFSLTFGRIRPTAALVEMIAALPVAQEAGA